MHRESVTQALLGTALLFKNFGRKFSVTCLRDESPFSLSNL